MTPETQRIAIAEACGWIIATNQNPPPFIWGYPNKESVGKAAQPVPDYLNDLNAMHEAEKVLGEFGSEVWAKYQRNLRAGDVVALSGELCHATAAQRAEAFLRTLGLWKAAADANISQLRLPKQDRGKPRCVCGFVGNTRNIRDHRMECTIWQAWVRAGMKATK